MLTPDQIDLSKITKLCNQCNNTKTGLEFPKGRDSNGLYYICRPCQSTNSNARRLAKPAKQRWVDQATSDARHRAKTNHLPFDFLKDDLLYLLQTQNDCCFYCNVNFEFDGKDRRTSPSVDRVEPSEGYSLINIVLACRRCNTIKNDATLQELQTIVQVLTERLTT